jgi:hypothetical protein
MIMQSSMTQTSWCRWFLQAEKCTFLQGPAAAGAPAAARCKLQAKTRGSAQLTLPGSQMSQIQKQAKQERMLPPMGLPLQERSAAEQSLAKTNSRLLL